MLSNIPHELQLLQQWVCFNVVEGKKIPYTPGTSSQAASNRPRDWRSFRAACKDVEIGRYQHIGFCFSSSDPYVFIDLDDPEDKDQLRVFKRIKTYAQRSISGEGAHLICRGTFKGKGKHPASPAAGIFKENRFCLMTGDILAGRSAIQIVPDEDIQAIHSWLKGGAADADEVELTEYEANIPDMEVLQNGLGRYHKFDALCKGQWEQFEEFGDDHSTADHAFLAMLCDLTPCNSQVRQFFRWSGMWNAERAEKKAGHGFDGYVNRTIKKIRATQARDSARMSAVTLMFGEEADTPDPVTVVEPVIPVHGESNLIESLPDGLIKDIARYSYQTSFYPLQEASLLVGLMLVSGLCGRSFMTPTKSGLNLWLILVGGTSCGKDEYQSGMKRLVNCVGKRLPAIHNLLGGELVSGPALENAFQDRKRLISYMPEFGDMFKSLANPNAPDYIRTLSRGLLNSYNAAGQHGSIEGRRKANGIEGVASIERPCLCLAGEATPESLYGNMTSRELATGFLQRFTVVNVPPASWSLEENAKSSAPPPRSLVDRLEQIALAADVADVKGTSRIVDGTAEALEMLRNYREKKRREIMQCPDGLSKKEVINRAGLKVLRIASLLAVSSDYYTPKITVEDAQWAINFVDYMDNDMLSKFSSGEVGMGQVKQESEILKAAASFSSMEKSARRKLGMTSKVAAEKKILPHALLKQAVINSAAFSNDRMGAVSAFEKCLDHMEKSGVVIKVKEDFAGKLNHVGGLLLCFP